MSDAGNGRTGVRNVLFLGMVSLFTDLSSQMIYPLVPVFLRSLGVSMEMIGLIEGIAESTASVFRTVFGRISDKVGRRKLFVFLGYGLSSVSKPFLYLAHSWPPVMGVRFADRFGKAIRTPARDALISTTVRSDRKGMAFGFHRAMDRLGAVGGPLLAMLVLHFAVGDEQQKLRLVFLFAFVPAILALVFVPFARETKQELKKGDGGRATGLRRPGFVIFVVASIVFTLGNASNAFLILKAQQVGLALAMVPLIWIVYNILCTVSSPIFGSLSDRVGRVPVVIASFIYYAVVYLLFGLATAEWQVWVLFAAYGIYYGLSDGILRAYIADLVEPEVRGTAYGIFNTGIGLALLPASIIFGAVWDSLGSSWAFFIAAGLSAVGFAIFLVSLAVERARNGRTPAA